MVRGGEARWINAPGGHGRDELGASLFFATAAVRTGLTAGDELANRFARFPGFAPAPH